MRKKALPNTIGVLGSFALAVSASADFTGFVAEMKGSYDTATDPFGPNVGVVDVWNIFATFDDPDNALTGIFVLEAEGLEMTHSSDLAKPFDGLGGGFWNWSMGTNTALPAGDTYNLNPAAADADTYLSLGFKAGTDAIDAAFFGPGHEAVLVASGILNGNGSITTDFTYVATPDDAQTYPIDGRVFVLNIAVLAGEHASGIWNLKWGAGTGIGVQWTTIPAPGALALFGLAGLAYSRHRRRSS